MLPTPRKKHGPVVRLTKLRESTSMSTPPSSAKLSPWLDPNKANLFQYEFQLVRENSTEESLKPLDIYSWISYHGGEQLLFRALARFAPMRPLFGYRGRATVWLSPHPAGFGNAIHMVFGHDATGRLRVVGGNLFNEPMREVGLPLHDVEFFKRFDHESRSGKQRLVMETARRSISATDTALLRDISRQCALYRTMPIYTTVLTPQGALFHAATAVIEGDHPTDFSYEHFGEIA